MPTVNTTEDDSLAAVSMADAIIERARLRRRKRSERDAAEVPAGWRYDKEPQRFRHEPKHQMEFRFSQREFEVFRLWGESLGYVHTSDPAMLRRVVREIGAGKICLVYFQNEAEYLDTLKLLNYVRRTFMALRRPFANAARSLCRSLALLRRVQYRLYKADPPTKIPLSPWEVKDRAGYWDQNRTKAACRARAAARALASRGSTPAPVAPTHDPAPSATVVSPDHT